MVDRRDFLKIMLATCAAPAIIKVSSLMPSRSPRIILYGDGFNDDTLAIQTIIDGGRVFLPDGRLYVPKDYGVIGQTECRIYRVTETIRAPDIALIPRDGWYQVDHPVVSFHAYGHNLGDGA